MRYAIAAAAGLILLLFAAISTAANRTVDAVAAHSSRSLSATEMVMQSRQTAPVVSSGNNALLWFALFLIIGGLIIAGLYLGRHALREWRLTTKRRKSAPRQLPTAEPLPELPYITDIRRPQSLPQLPDYETN
jgi:uncharacterized iron-regulated membrane protein